MGLVWAVQPAARAICQAGIGPTCKVIFQSYRGQAGSSKSFTYCCWDGLPGGGGPARLFPLQAHHYLFTEALATPSVCQRQQPLKRASEKPWLASHPMLRALCYALPASSQPRKTRRLEIRTFWTIGGPGKWGGPQGIGSRQRCRLYTPSRIYQPPLCFSFLKYLNLLRCLSL